MGYLQIFPGSSPSHFPLNGAPRELSHLPQDIPAPNSAWPGTSAGLAILQPSTASHCQDPCPAWIFTPTCALTVHSELCLCRGHTHTVLGQAAVDAHVCWHHSRDDELVATLLVLTDHVVVILLQHPPVLEPAHAGHRLACHHTVKAHRVPIQHLLIL